MSVTRTDVEHLCGRPLAFCSFVDRLLAQHFVDANTYAQVFGRGAELRVELEHNVVWWIWPWDPEHTQPRAWWRCRDDDMSSLRRHLPDQRNMDPPILRVVLARTPAQPQAWLDALAQWLARHTNKAFGACELLGPDALVELARTQGLDASELPMLSLTRALAARRETRSPAEQVLVDALDASEAEDAHWAVLADELLAKGDPLAESLALSVAARQPTRGGRERLARQASKCETERVLALSRARQLLSFASPAGQRFDVLDFGPQPELEQGTHYIQLWAQRCGPFVTHLLANTDYPAWDGLGLPAPLLHAPELRYLSMRRYACISPGSADLSGCELPGFVLGEIEPGRESICAVEAQLHGCDLRQACLREWSFDGAQLEGVLADLGTQLSGASFVEARVSPSLERQLRSAGQRGRIDSRGVVVV